MWSIKETPDTATQNAGVKLDILQFGKGLPKEGDAHQLEGFSFFELRKHQVDTLGEEYITSRITSIPTLTAVTESQFNSWNSKKIIAKPCIFTANSSLIKTIGLLEVL